MTNIHAADSPRKSREFTSFIFAVLRQIDADPKTSAMEFRLAYVLSQMLNDETRVCFPLQSTLAQRLGVTDRAVRQYIAGLVDRGHLRVAHRGRESSALYELILHERNTASGHDAGRPEDTFRSCEEDRKSDVVRPEISRRKTGTMLPTEPTSITNLNNQSLPGGRKVPAPESVSGQMLAYALEKAEWSSIRAATEFEKFRDHHLAKGNDYSDWLAAWRTWVRRGATYDQERAQRGAPHSPRAAGNSHIDTSLAIARQLQQRSASDGR